MSQLPSIISSLERIQQFHAKEIWKGEPSENEFQLLVNNISLIKKEIEEIGEAAEFRLESGTAEKEDYFILYCWVEQAKLLMLLWRDILFQRHKAQILHKDEAISIETVEQLERESEQTLQEAHAAFMGFSENELKNVSKKQIEQWKHQKSPWIIYKNQINEIEKQSQKIFEQREDLSKNISYFKTIENIIKNLLSECDKEVETIKNLAPRTDAYIREHIQIEGEAKFGRVINHLEEIEKNFSINHHLKSFLDRWENEKLSLPKKQSYIVGIEEGILLRKEITLNKNVRQWIDSEILPLLYEAWELLERIEHEFKISIANIRNRTILVSKEEQAATNEINNLCFPLENFSKKTSQNEQLLVALVEQITHKLENEFQLSLIFDPRKPFLVVPFQNTMSQLRLNQSSLINRIYVWWTNQGANLRKLKRNLEQGEVLSLSERIARLIQQRKEASDFLHYASIFQTEGYIGESFYVGRQEEMNRVEILVKQWYEGFRGTLLLTGQRFSGKTLFAEYTMNRHFSANTIILSPNRTIELQGRKMTTTYDLEEALTFIQKYSLNQKIMVWIDDLELWRDPQLPLGKNVRQLFNFFDNYATRIFFVVSMSNWLKAHLSKYYEINKLFQAEINMDRMSMQEVREAILIRHGATHKTLINHKDTEVTPTQFQRLSNKIYKSADGNIGEALMRWSYAIRATEDEDKVRFDSDVLNNFPDFLNPDTALLLSAIMMEKKTNEYRLRKLFGAPFNEKYSGILQRLLNVGILKRDLTGWLEINEFIVNDLGRLLDRKKYITFKNEHS